MDPNFLYYGLFRIRGEDIALVIGPVSPSPVSRNLARKILARMGEPVSRTQEVLDYFSVMPAYPLRNFLQILCTIQYFINGEKVSVSSFLLDEEDPPKLPAFYTPDMPAPEHFMHNTLKLEERLLSNVEHGRADEIEKLFQRPAEGRAGSMADSALRQEKNLSSARRLWFPGPLSGAGWTRKRPFPSVTISYRRPSSWTTWRL